MMRLDSGNLGNLDTEDGDWDRILADIDTWAGILMGSPDIDPWGSLLLGRAVNKQSQSFTLPREGLY